jgi:hypothetical protein
LTVTVWVPRPNVPRPLLPVPSEASVSVAVPLRAPAELVSRPTSNEVLSVLPAASRLKEPPASTLPLPPMLALSASENPSAAAVLVMLSATWPLSPTRWLANSTGLGVAALALRQAVDVARDAESLRADAQRAKAAGAGAVRRQRDGGGAALGAGGAGVHAHEERAAAGPAASTLKLPPAVALPLALMLAFRPSLKPSARRCCSA